MGETSNSCEEPSMEVAIGKGLLMQNQGPPTCGEVGRQAWRGAWRTGSHHLGAFCLPSKFERVVGIRVPQRRYYLWITEDAITLKRNTANRMRAPSASGQPRRGAASSEVSACPDQRVLAPESQSRHFRLRYIWSGNFVSLIDFSIRTVHLVFFESHARRYSREKVLTAAVAVPCTRISGSSLRHPTNCQSGCPRIQMASCGSPFFGALRRMVLTYSTTTILKHLSS